MNRECYQNNEEVGNSLTRLKALLDLLGCLSGADQKIIRTDMIAEVFCAIAELVELIREDVDVIIDKELTNTKTN